MLSVNDASDDWNPDNQARVSAPRTTSEDLWSNECETFWIKTEKSEGNMQQN